MQLLKELAFYVNVSFFKN